ncbi:cell division cycle and apoptosis regulator protein 1-like [Quillaja saponaria]|uniref:Cell division cycle and apoptosis regulator protein 1-like n=1 Tax=Quillaja saponaria TaxID=32244 RepID=A0AAD7P680_QUISA|nr:cell division cycle and apoptosis regulator protein 1-like [Quillaja saponaria]
MVVQAGDTTGGTGKQTADADNVVNPVKKTEKKMITKAKSITPIPKKQDDVVDSSKSEFKSEKEDKKDEKGNGEKAASGSGADMQKGSQRDSHDGKRGNLKDGEKSKDEKDRKEKDESQNKLNKEVKEKRKHEEPPRHPGLILQTKWNKDSKPRTLSLSLDSLLDYTDKDIEESTFELSLFAESLYEMLQYQMGCRILTFLRKLRTKFVMVRYQRKRQRENNHEKGKVKKSQTKRRKTDELPVKNKSTDMETSNAAQPEDEKPMAKDDKSIDKENDVKMEDRSDDDEDPEEDPEEFDETEDGSLQHDSSSGEKNEEPKAIANAEPENVSRNEKEDDSSKEEPKVKAAETNPKSVVSSHQENEGKLDRIKKEITSVKEAAVDKELLQAFRFFDRNRVGYIRVEDMRLVIHNLGKFLSHRDVKELVQSALLESNTGRDDRILYNKLVRMCEL